LAFTGAGRECCLCPFNSSVEGSLMHLMTGALILTGSRGLLSFPLYM
jgi:hypothetical protein